MANVDFVLPAIRFPQDKLGRHPSLFVRFLMRPWYAGVTSLFVMTLCAVPGLPSLLAPTRPDL
jgi:hypothetical protein